MNLNTSAARLAKRYRPSLPGFASTINGIPCLIEVTYFFRQKPLGPRCDSDYDCYGYTECEYNVLDRKGYPAKWLEKLMTDADKARIDCEIDAQDNEGEDF